MATSKKTDESGITMADVAALNGVDASTADAPAPAALDVDANAPIAVKYEDDGSAVPFMSEGMRHDLVQLGHVYDPNTRRKIIPA
jgi:hypothetical protein